MSYWILLLKTLLNKAEENKIQSIAFSAISSGIFGFPKSQCADIFMSTIWDYFNENAVDTSINEISWTIVDDETVEEFYKAYDRKFR